MRNKAHLVETKSSDTRAHQIDIDPVPSHIKESHSDVAHYDPSVGRLGRGGEGVAEERCRRSRSRRV